MSRRRHYTPYNTYASANNETPVVINEDTVKETKVESTEESVENLDIIDPEMEEKVEEAIPETIKGKVVNCEMVNVRVEPSPSAQIITIIYADSIVTVYPEKSTDRFYAVRTEEGIPGYINRDFIITFVEDK